MFECLPAAGPPFPLLALLVLLLLGTRSGSWLPGIGLLAVATLLATLHARGLRVVMRVGASHVLLPLAICANPMAAGARVALKWSQQQQQH